MKTLITVNSVTRQFNVPGSDLVFGVSGDSDVERKHFQCPRYVGDGLDLAACFIRMNYRNANGAMDFYLVDDLAIDGDNITFSWLLSPRVTEYKGQVKFVMCAVGPDLKLKWHTTQGTGQVMDGLEPDNSHVESQTADVVAQLIAMVDAQTVAVEKVGAEQVANVNATAETATMAAVNEIEAKRANSLASIPNDYTSLSSAVESLTRGKATAIVCDAEGSAVAVSDASDMPIQGMRIFGRSTQNGTPTPIAPVEIVSVENPAVMVGGKNLLTRPYRDGVSKNHGGVTYTVNPDGSVHAVGTVTATSSHFILNAVDFGEQNISEGFSNGKYHWTDCLYNGSNKYTMIYLLKGAEVDKTFYPRVSLGTAPSEFETPREAQAVEITHPLRGIPVIDGGNYTDANGQRWICDEVDLERGVYVKRIGDITFDGSQTYHINVYQQGYGYYVFGCSRFGASYTNAPVMCDRLTFKPWASWNMVTGGNLICYETSSFYFYLKDQSIQTIEAFAEYLTTNPIHTLYAMATPTETPLSETELAAYRNLHSNYPNTTVLNDAGAHMVVKYAADTKLYIDNKIKEALK